MAEFAKAAMPWVITGIFLAIACVHGDGEAKKNALAEKKHRQKSK